MCIHGDTPVATKQSVKAEAKTRLVTAKSYVKQLTSELRQATKEMGKRQRAYVNA